MSGATCKFCGVYQDDHDYEHMARECYPTQIDIKDRLIDGLESNLEKFRQGFDETSRAHLVTLASLALAVEALEKILSHQERLVGDMVAISTTARIARAALATIKGER